MPKRILQWFDVKAAFYGALLMGTIVGFVNSAHGLAPALTSAAKQAAYTFFFAGLVMQHCRWVATIKLSPAVAVGLATVWPTLLTVILVYSLHNFKGTPEPVLSTIPPAVLGFITFFLVSRSVVYA